MKNFFNSLRNGIMGVGADDDELYEDDYGYYEDEDSYYDENEYEDRPVKKPSLVEGFPSRGTTPRADKGRDAKRTSRTSRSKNQTSDVLRMPIEYQEEETDVYKCEPLTVEDAREVSALIKRRQICVVNLSGLDKDTSQRIVDFISGTCDALGGEIEPISKSIFAVAPQGVRIHQSMRDDIRSSGGRALFGRK